MKSRRSEIVVQFKQTPVAMFGEGGERPTGWCCVCSRMRRVDLWLNVKEPGPGGLRVKQVPLEPELRRASPLRYPDAYERLLMDVVRGNLALFMRRDEVEAAWTWADALLSAWEREGERAATLRCRHGRPACLRVDAGSRPARLVGSGVSRAR